MCGGVQFHPTVKDTFASAGMMGSCNLVVVVVMVVMGVWVGGWWVWRNIPAGGGWCPARVASVVRLCTVPSKLPTPFNNPLFPPVHVDSLPRLTSCAHHRHPVPTHTPDRDVRLWDLTNRACTTKVVVSSADDLAHEVGLTMDTGSSSSSSSSSDGVAVVASVVSPTQSLNPPFVQALHFSPNGRLLATGGGDGSCHVFGAGPKQGSLRCVCGACACARACACVSEIRRQEDHFLGEDRSACCVAARCVFVLFRLSRLLLPRSKVAAFNAHGAAVSQVGPMDWMVLRLL
jgi:hypothetical protein